jgi:hypothetical protein
MFTMTPEGKIEKHLKKEVQASGGKLRKLKWIGKSGAPDRLIWWPRKGDEPFSFALIELKAATKKPTKVQEIEHDALREDGWTVLVADSIEAVDAAILLVRDGVVMKRKPAKPDVPPAKPWAPPPKQPDLPKQDNDDLL